MDLGRSTQEKGEDNFFLLENARRISDNTMTFQKWGIRTLLYNLPCNWVEFFFLSSRVMRAPHVKKNYSILPRIITP